MTRVNEKVQKENNISCPITNKSIVVYKQFESLKKALSDILETSDFSKVSEIEGNALTLEVLQSLLGDEFFSFISKMVSTKKFN